MFRRFCVLLMLCIGFVASVHAAKVGTASLLIRQFGTPMVPLVTSSVPPVVEVGDVFGVELFTQSNDDILTGVSIYLDFDDQYLELVSSGTSADDVLPFKQGFYLQGAVYANSTLGDMIGNGNLNNVPKFQLYYGEDVPPSNGSVRGVVGNGTLATAQFRVIKRPDAGLTVINVVPISPFGSETGYFVKGDPGNIYAFDNIEDLPITIVDPALVASVDFDGSGVVDFSDFLNFANAFGSDQSTYDLDGNGTVDLPDFLKFVGVFGQTVSP